MEINSRCLNRLVSATGGVTSAAVCTVRDRIEAASLSHCSVSSGELRNFSEIRVCSAAVTLYGVFGLGAGIGLALRKPWSLVMTRCWSVAIVTAAVAAPLGWAPGETPWWGVALGGIVTAALAFGVLRMVRMLLRRPGPPGSRM